MTHQLTPRQSQRAVGSTRIALRNFRNLEQKQRKMGNGYIIRNTPIAVDYWHISYKPYLRYFFLTHCHADHTDGLNERWNRRIYCSPITANLATRLLGIKPELFITIEVDETITVDYDDDNGQRLSFHVTALEANHCPGSIMFLFDGWFGRILSTGDLRYEQDIIDVGRLQMHRIDVLYLDGTNWQNEQKLPTRGEALEECLQTIATKPNNEVFLLALPQVRLGKERLLVEISRRFGEKICVDEKRIESAKVLGVSDFNLGQLGIE